MRVDRAGDLTATTFRNLGRTNRAGPNAAAYLETLVMRGLVLDGLPDLYLTLVPTPPEAFSRAAIRQKQADNGLDSEALSPVLSPAVGG